MPECQWLASGRARWKPEPERLTIPPLEEKELCLSLSISPQFSHLAIGPRGPLPRHRMKTDEQMIKQVLSAGKNYVVKRQPGRWPWEETAPHAAHCSA